MKPRVQARWREVHAEDAAKAQGQGQSQSNQAGEGTQGTAHAPAAAVGGTQGDFVSREQQAAFSLMNSYADVVLCNHPYETDTSRPSALRDAYLLHIGGGAGGGGHQELRPRVHVFGRASGKVQEGGDTHKCINVP